MRSRQGSGSCTLLCLFATANAVAVGGASTAISLGGESGLPRRRAPDGDADPSRLRRWPDHGGGCRCIATVGEWKIALTIGLPIDTSTGQVAGIGSLTVRLLSDGEHSESLTLQLSHPSWQISLAIDDIAAGGPYTLDVIATADGDVTCLGSSPPFFVSADRTVRVLESIVCGGDAGLASTLSPGPAL